MLAALRGLGWLRGAGRGHERRGRPLAPRLAAAPAQAPSAAAAPRSASPGQASTPNVLLPRQGAEPQDEPSAGAAVRGVPAALPAARLAATVVVWTRGGRETDDLAVALRLVGVANRAPSIP